MIEMIFIPLLTVILSITILALASFFSFQAPEVSAETLNYFPKKEVERAQNYNRCAYLFRTGRTAAAIAVLTGAFLLVVKTEHIYLSMGNLYLQVAVYYASISALLKLILFPLEYCENFVIENRFGFSKQKFSEWLGDNVKASALSFIFSLLILEAFYALVKAQPDAWPFLAAGAFFILLFLQLVLYPVFIAPIFNKFQPLEKGELHDTLTQLAEKEGISVSKIYVMDASRRTTKANAYFTGFGLTKRIVLFDNLIRSFSKDEIAAVAAHEIGHWKQGHIRKGIMLSTALMLLFMMLYAAAASYARIPVSSPESVFLLLLMGAAFSILLTPLTNTAMRRFETQADQNALDLAEDPAAIIEMERRLALHNLSDVQPHPFIKFIFFTHPPIMERIKAAERYRSENLNC